jgi:small subunit ribosomal protein YMR-31
MTGASLGSVEPASGQYFDRSQLPPKFAKLPWTLAEMEAIESGGATTVAAA